MDWDQIQDEIAKERRKPKKDCYCLYWSIKYIAIIAVGVFLCRKYTVVKNWFGLLYQVGFFFCCFVSLPLMGIKGKVGEFFQELAATSRFYFLGIMPIFVFGCLVK